ncbi:MAG: tetratricopeptide (TPR) repeat protein [Verrucomicrobiales bacterium]
MAAELTLKFPDKTTVQVQFDGADSGALNFTNPFTEKDKADIRWYVETYGAASLAEPDDTEAVRIRERLPEIGKALFKSVLGDAAALEPFLEFRNARANQRVITIDSGEASVLSLPWELLHDPRGVFLFREKPHISIRRRISGAQEGRKPFKIRPKDQLHLLFVVSRPKGAGFIDPRADPKAVLDAVEKHAPGRVTCEFLHPPTHNALVERLDDDAKPPIDILHFDGHGVFAKVTDEEAKKNAHLYGKSIDSVIQRERQSRKDQNADSPVGIGFLLFEKEDREKHLISAEELHKTLYRNKVGLIVLSACQSATVDTEGDPMASVAGKLTATGIPAILAMTHSVLVATTRDLFGKFYSSLARGRGIATALDDARTFLANNPEKYEVQREKGRQRLELEDWFIPALFHGGEEVAMLRSGGFQPPSESSETDQRRLDATTTSNLRKSHETGFFGRRHELWQIERWFASGETRRISITGFGGQGKTELALEAGRWLLRTGLFKRAVFIDYASVQSEDAVSVAVSTIGATLGQSLPDADAVTECLVDVEAPTLIILDNLETLDPGPLRELLDAAVPWSTAGKSRVLITTRKPDLDHPDYRIEGTRIHRRIALTGLGSRVNPDDALEWFGELNKLPLADENERVPPPSREAVIDLFEKVDFHPLSIAVLAQELRTRSARKLGERLEELLSGDAISGIAGEGTPKSLIASLELSLERLSPEERDAMRKLGVFQGGAMESSLLEITELGEAEARNQAGKRERLQQLLVGLEGEDSGRTLEMLAANLPEGAELPADFAEQLRARLAEMPEPEAPSFTVPGPSTNLWPSLRRQLETTGLIEAETIPGVGQPFLRFHPTLAPILWAGLPGEDRDALIIAHRQCYQDLATFLGTFDRKNPRLARSITLRELPNLLHAVQQAFNAEDPDAAEFADTVYQFVGTYFGMKKDVAALFRSAGDLAASANAGSNSWIRVKTNQGEHLLENGQIQEASAIFTEVREVLGKTPRFELFLTHFFLGRCLKGSGRPDLAETEFRRGFLVIDALPSDDQFRGYRGSLFTELGDVLRNQGNLTEAREAYQKSLAIFYELSNERAQAVTIGQLGSLAMLEGNLTEAVELFRKALEQFRALNEPPHVAIYLYQLGVAFRRTGELEQAERYFRDAAELDAKLGNLIGAAQSWSQLANVAQVMGNSTSAETWYRRAIKAVRGQPAHLARELNNLANLLLHSDASRLDEALDLARESLNIKKTLDHGATKIWLNYEILAQISDQNAQLAEAEAYRHEARKAKWNFAGTAHEMKHHLDLIRGSVQAVINPDSDAAVQFQSGLPKAENGHRKNFVAAIRHIRENGTESQDGNDISEKFKLDLEAAMIVETILEALADPEAFAAKFGLTSEAAEDPE